MFIFVLLQYHLRLMLLKCPFGKHLQILRIELVSDEKTVKTIADFCPNLTTLVINNYKIESNAFKRIANKCTNLQCLSINETSYAEDLSVQTEQFIRMLSDDTAAPAAPALGGLFTPLFGTPPAPAPAPVATAPVSIDTLNWESRSRIPMDESLRVIALASSNSSSSGILKHLKLYNCHISATTVKMLLLQHKGSSSSNDEGNNTTANSNKFAEDSLITPVSVSMKRLEEAKKQAMARLKAKQQQLLNVHQQPTVPQQQQHGVEDVIMQDSQDQQQQQFYKKSYMETLVCEGCSVDEEFVQHVCDYGSALRVLHLSNNPKLSTMVQMPESVRVISISNST